MKKTAYSAILILALLFLVEAQVAMVLANPHWPFPDSGYPDWGYPKITITSPVQNGTYTENNVWLNLSVTKPSNWTDFKGQLKYEHFQFFFRKHWIHFVQPFFFTLPRPCSII